jgi:transcriptional regulator with XRE-family HTH domain
LFLRRPVWQTLDVTIVETPDDELEANIRTNVRLALALHDMTSVELARRINVSAATFSQKLTGARRFTATELLRLCEVLNIAPAAIVRRVDVGFQNWKFLRAGVTTPQARRVAA